MSSKFILSILLPMIGLPASPLADTTRAFDALVFHPGSKRTEPISATIIQTLEKDETIREYYIDVESVICGDGQCEIITVRLSWNPLGEFLCYEFPEGGNLTKRGHEQFTPEDHAKLLAILQDPGSLLKDVHAKDVLHPGESKEGDEIDGTSGATLLSDKSSIVSGAVYTCYTLWHWVNGDIQTEIRKISEETMQMDQLLTFLQDPSPEKNRFAIEQLTERRVQDSAAYAVIHNLALHGHTELARSAIEYFQSLGTDTFYIAIKELFKQGSSKKQVLYLSAMASTDLPPPEGFYDNLSENLPNLGSYYEVHLLLNLLAKHNPESETTISNTLPLLNNTSFLIGRRAYNFLRDRELAPSQQAQVEAFQTRYADRL